MSRILDAWKESASLLVVSRNLPFWMVCVHTLKQLGQEVVARWPLFATIIGALIITRGLGGGTNLVVGSFLLLTIVLAIRPSIERKTYSYYLSMLKKIMWVFPVIVLLRLIAAQSVIADGIVPAYCVLLALFALDGSERAQSFPSIIRRSLLFALLNFPFITAVSGLFLVAQLSMVTIMSILGIRVVSFFGGALILFILRPFLIVITTNYYIKKIHEDFDLYCLGICTKKDA